MDTPRLVVDRKQIDTFVADLFKHAEPGEYVSLRGFDQFRRDVPPVIIHAHEVTSDLDAMVTAAVEAARICSDAAEPAVFAPPICTFVNGERARVVDLASGLVLSVELDDVDPDVALATLAALLGPPTLVVASGSVWTNLETGQTKPKIHIHWRLNEPTRTPDDHQRLRHARDLAARLVGADPTGKPVVHPLRWPGSWNRKGVPRMARIIDRNPDAEIDLGETLERLEDAVEAAGFEDATGPRVSSAPQASVELVLAAFAAIPNPGRDVHYDQWIRLGYAIINATGGTENALAAFHSWSQKSEKYGAVETDAAWGRINAAINGANAPRKVGAGTIFFLARRAGWEWPSAPTDGGEPASNNPNAVAETEAPTDPVGALVTELNRRYMVVNEAGKVIIYEPVHDHLLKRKFYQRITFDDFRRLYMNLRIRVGQDKDGNPVTAPAADVWLRHPDRRQYIGGIIFDPSGKAPPADILNLWQGFAVVPRAGSWALLRAHVLEVICDGKQEYFTFLMCWMARLVQYPGEQGEIAVVLRGGEGTGKGTLARVLLGLLGQHGLAVSNSKHLTGHFNGHLRDVVFLFADEAFFAGDKAHVGILKTLITEPYLTIEAKYQNAMQMPNYIHLMMASNEDWVVPAALDARRFFVLEVSAAKANDHAYFAKIWKEMDAGGYEAMLQELLQLDLTHFNPRRAPVTAGLQTQRKLSLPAAEDWWMDVLMRGYVFRSKLGLEDYFGQWHEDMTTEVLFESYTDYARMKGERRHMSREEFGKFMVRMGAKAFKPRNAVVGEHIKDVDNGYGGTTRRAEPIRTDRPTGYRLGNLAGARIAFLEATSLPVNWPGEAGDAA